MMSLKPKIIGNCRVCNGDIHEGEKWVGIKTGYMFHVKCVDVTKETKTYILYKIPKGGQIRKRK